MILYAVYRHSPAITAMQTRPISSPACSSAQGIESKEVPIIVFHIAKLKINNLSNSVSLKIYRMYAEVLMIIYLHSNKRTLLAFTRRNAQKLELIELDWQHMVGY